MDISFETDIGALVETGWRVVIDEGPVPTGDLLGAQASTRNGLAGTWLPNHRVLLCS
jgi:hypothetical protein